MKSSSVIATVLVLGVAVGGGIYLMNKSKGTSVTDVRVVKTYAGFGDNPDVWAFVIYAGPQTAPGRPPVILHGPDGPYASKEAAETAGANWLSEHPLV